MTKWSERFIVTSGALLCQLTFCLPFAGVWKVASVKHSLTMFTKAKRWVLDVVSGEKNLYQVCYAE